MILTELRHYISTHRRVTLVDLINRFEIEPEALGSGACTTGCSKCSPESLEFYEWVA
jgi:putative ferrous iron transport protein C